MERGRNLPIIAMTAAVMQRDKDASDAAGMNGHIAKPINMDELVSVLMTWVPQRPNETEISIHPESRQAYSINAPLESTPDFDLNITLGWLGGDQNLLKQVLTSFQLDLVKINNDIRDAGEQGDWKIVKAIAHKLKGTAGNMGALALQRQAAELDAELMKQSTVNLSVMVEKIEQTSELCKRFITGLENHLIVDLSASRDEVEKILNELATILTHNRLIPAKLLEKIQAAQTWGVSKDLLERFGQETGMFQYKQALLTLELIRKELESKQC
jgi:HPt (histidine-containing phosphotransfer) domain-containing protein